jgi:hypothetical protein
MSDIDDTDDDTTPDDDAAPALAPALPERSRNPLARDTDFVARPGFRNPANAKSKALKKAKTSSGKKKR